MAFSNSNQLVNLGLNVEQAAAFYRQLTHAVAPAVVPPQWIQDASLEVLQERLNEMCVSDSLMQRFVEPTYLHPLSYGQMVFSVTGSPGSVKALKGEAFVAKTIGHMRTWSVETW